jgi:DNA-binding NarL/FixJ family response regulator
MDALHLLLIDDHAMFRTGLRMVLAASLDGVEVQEAGSLEESLREVAVAPALVLLDVHLPGLNGVEGIALLRRKWPATPVLMLSSQGGQEIQRLALLRGAVGYVSKADTAERIVAMVRQVLHGEAPAPPSAGGPGELAEALTPRQQDVLVLLSQGLSNKLIGRRLDLSEHTVRGHVQGIFRFLGVASRSEAAFAARKRGLVE